MGNREKALNWWKGMTIEQQQKCCDKFGKEFYLVSATGFQIQKLYEDVSEAFEAREKK
jgi:hypothetical protein